MSSSPPRVDASTYGPANGESEVTFGGSLGIKSTDSSLNGVSGGTTDDIGLTAQVGYGYYVTRSHELGAQVLFNLNRPDGGGDNGTIGLFPYYRLNFRGADRLQFYVGAHGGLQQFEQDDQMGGSQSDSGFSYGGHVGLKSWLTPDLSFFFEPRFTLSTLSFDSVDVDIEEFRVLLGFTYAL